MGGLPSHDVSNVLSEEKRQQIIALGRLGWSLRRIEKETGIRRETASGYLKAAGIVLRPQGRWGRSVPESANPSKPANETSTDFGVDSARIGAPGEPLATPEHSGYGKTGQRGVPRL